MSDEPSTLDTLAKKHCRPWEGGVPRLDCPAAEALLRELGEGWELNEPCTEIARDFSFKGYYKTMAFVNAVAWIANRENHHPDLEVGYNH